MMQILGIATEHPPLKLSQKKLLQFILKHFKMRPGAKSLYQKVFANESIKERRFSVKRIEEVLEKNPDVVNRRFEEESVKISAQSLLKALKKAKVSPKKIEFLIVTTCTGYLCPGISTQLIQRCGLNKEIRCMDLVGMGCGSAIPAMEQATYFLKANPNKIAAIVCTEICSAAIHSDHTPDLIVSNTIFADGSASVVFKNSARKGRAQILSFSRKNYPEWKETLRFIMEGGRLRNVLGREVPSRAGESLKELTGQILSENRLSPDHIQHWIPHAGGEKVLDSIEQSLQLSKSQMNPSRNTLKNHGNLSSPTVLYTLKDILDSSHPPKQGDLGLMMSFGAGFSVYACLIRF